jgi:hypothetical protein
MIAAERGNLQMAKELVDRGEDAQAEDDHGNTAIDYARKNNHTAIAGYLRLHCHYATDTEKYAHELRCILWCDPEAIEGSGDIVPDLCRDVSWAGKTLQLGFTSTPGFRQQAAMLLRALATRMVLCKEWTKEDADDLLNSGNSEDPAALLLPAAEAEEIMAQDFQHISYTKCGNRQLVTPKQLCIAWVLMYIGTRYPYEDNEIVFEQLFPRWW